MPEIKKKLQIENPKNLLSISSFHVEIDKTRTGYGVVSSGVIRIREVSENKISLKCKEGVVSVLGRRLSISLYENKTVEISGKIEEITLGNSKN